MSRVRAPSIAHFLKMSWIQAIFLGLIQGATEFFPISSSAHLRLAKKLMGLEVDLDPTFDLICHLGTLFSLLFVLKKEVFAILLSPRKMLLYFVALLPLIPVYFLLKPVREYLSEPAFMGYALIMTALLLWAASKKKETKPDKKWRHVLCIGMMQTVALIPGISRSGSTIAAARFCGWSFLEAAQFSFLLSIPAILGGEMLQFMKSDFSLKYSTGCYWGAFLASFALGLLGARLIFSLYQKEIVRPFAWYCFLLGIVSWGWFHG